uniref:Uncharacterized protein n=1 Tax=Anguilla anguilla TaxID=7936 RepID=A0A0E9UJ01_ANGAN
MYWGRSHDAHDQVITYGQRVPQATYTEGLLDLVVLVKEPCRWACLVPVYTQEIKSYSHSTLRVYAMAKQKTIIPPENL